MVCFSSGNRHMKDKPSSRWSCTALTPQNKEHVDQLFHANWWIMTRKLCMCSILLSASVHWGQWWQHWNIAKSAPGGIHKCSHMNSKIIRKFIRIYWINMRLKVIVSCTTSLPMMKYGITTTSQSQNDSPWSADIWIRHWRNVQGAAFKGQSTLYFGIAKGWSFWTSWKLNKLSTLTATSQCWPSWRLELQDRVLDREQGQRRKPFSCNTIMLEPR